MSFMDFQLVVLLTGNFSDSGGPLQCNDNLVGIVSYGTRVCAVSMPDVYTRSSEFVGKKNVMKIQLWRDYFTHYFRLD